MIAWRSFGASVIGPGHVKSALPNQDAFLEIHADGYDCIVASDGVGSCPKSEMGSIAACRAVARAAASLVEERGPFDEHAFADDVVRRFLQGVAPFPPQECSATCLYAIRHDGEIRLGMVGDGLAACLLDDGTFLSLADDKTDSFSNLVSALSPETTSADWKFLHCPEERCRGVVLCTDGISDDLLDARSFVKAFLADASMKSSEACVEETYGMLLNWSVPKHSDDKTLVCLLPEEVEDGAPA